MFIESVSDNERIRGRVDEYRSELNETSPRTYRAFLRREYTAPIEVSEALTQNCRITQSLPERIFYVNRGMPLLV